MNIRLPVKQTRMGPPVCVFRLGFLSVGSGPSGGRGGGRPAAAVACFELDGKRWTAGRLVVVLFSLGFSHRAPIAGFLTLPRCSFGVFT